MFLILGIGCKEKSDNTSNPSTDSPKPKNVAILKLGSHTLIDEVESSIFRGLKNRYGSTVNISIYNANFEEDILRQSVDQIVSSSFDVAVPITTDASMALINAAPEKLKIVFSFVSSPQSLWGETGKKPLNVSGTSDQIDYEKNLRLIASLFPQATNIGYIVNESEIQAKLGFEEVKQLAPNFSFKIIQGAIASSGDVTNAARSLLSGVDLFLVGGDNTVVSALGGLLTIADRSNKPVFAVERTSVEKGCIAAYGIDYTDLGNQTADMVIKVLEDQNIAHLPVIYYKETKLYINRSAFLKAGLQIPENAFRIY